MIKLFKNSELYLRDFVPIETVVDVHQRFFNVNNSGIWNVGTGQTTSFEEVAQTIADKYNAKIEYITMPDNDKSQYQTFTCADVTQLRKYYP